MRRWVTAGQDPSAFWQITPREVMVILDGSDARDRARMRIDQAVAWATARLVMIGINTPAKFPKFEKAFPDPTERKVVQSPDDIWAAMERWCAVAELREDGEAKV